MAEVTARKVAAIVNNYNKREARRHLAKARACRQNGDHSGFVFWMDRARFRIQNSIDIRKTHLTA